MALRIKNYARFQHFKDRNPPWVKLYRDLLDDPDWHELDDRSAKILVMLWLIASEDETKCGMLPDNRKLCFRLRTSEKDLAKALSSLSHWVKQDDKSAISTCYQVDAPETETEAETEQSPLALSESVDDGFATFWEQYPRKEAKAAARKAWDKIKPDGQMLANLMAGLGRQKATEQWRKDGGKFIPYPATWLTGQRWEDEVPTNQGELGLVPAAQRPQPGDTRTRFGRTERFDETLGWIPE